MDDKSLDFQNINDNSSLPGIVRKSFRVPIEDQGSVWVIIHNNKYPVQDICCDGVSITTKSSDVFKVDEFIPGCELVISNDSFKNLNARVIHLTARKGNIWQYGIHWEKIEEKSSKEISKIVTKMKEELLKQEHEQTDQ